MGEISEYYRDKDLNKRPIKPLKPKLHKCKDGAIVDIRGVSKEHPKMTDTHLLNTIAYIKRRAKEGITISYGGGSNGDDMWYDEDIISGKKVLKHLKYKHYVDEALKRNITI